MNLRRYHQKWVSYKRGLKALHPVAYTLVDFAETIVVALIFALIIRQYVIMTSLVPSESMVPTFMVRDRLFVNKFIYRFVEPERGDIVVFKSPRGDNKDYVKRLVGLPGETLEVKKGEIYIDGVPVVFAGVDIRYDYSYFGPVIIPEDSFFVMGDNRANSYDSRFWTSPNYFVPKDKLEGKAWFTFYPFYRLRPLK